MYPPLSKGQVSRCLICFRAIERLSVLESSNKRGFEVESILVIFKIHKASVYQALIRRPSSSLACVKLSE